MLILSPFWGTLFQLAISLFNWFDKVIEVGCMEVGRMLNEGASRGQNAKETGEETTIEGLKKEYSWWMPTHHAVKLVKSFEKTEVTVLLFEGKNTRM